MRPLTLLPVLLSAVSVSAQDTIPDEDQILQKIELGTPSDASVYTRILERLTDKPIDSLVLRDCVYYYHDQPFTGAIRATVSDSVYTLTHCDEGRTSGAVLTMHRYGADSSFQRERIVYPFGSTGDRVAYATYYPSQKIKAEGCAFVHPCGTFQPVFGSLGPDCTYREYYGNGQLKEQATVRDGEYNGVRELFYENGQLKEHQEYAYRRPWGEWRQYAETGECTGKMHVEGNQAHGRWDGQRIRK